MNSEYQDIEEIYRSKTNYLLMLFHTFLIFITFLRKPESVTVHTNILIFCLLMIVYFWLFLSYTRITKSQIEQIRVLNYLFFKRKSITPLSQVFLIEVEGEDSKFNYKQQVNIYLDEMDFKKKKESKAIIITYKSAREIESIIRFAYEQNIPLKIDINKRYWKDRELLLKYHTYNSEKNDPS